MRKFIAMLLALLMVLSMVACGAKQQTPAAPAATETEEPKTEAPAEPQGQTTEAAAAVVEEAQEPITIEYWYQNSNYTEWIEKMAADFHEANPSITVVPEIFGDDKALTTALTAAFQDGSAPAIFHTRSNANLTTFFNAGMLEPLSNYDFAKRLNDAAIEAATIDGQLIAACFGSSAFCVVYNADIFAELGLTAPNTFDEMVAVIKACQDAGYGGIAYPGADANHVWLSRAMFHTTMGRTGYQEFEEGIDQGIVTDVVAETLAVESMKSIGAYYDNGLWYNGVDAMSNEAAQTLLLNKEAAMIVTYTGNTVSNPIFEGLNLGFFPLLSLTGNGEYYAEVNNMISVYAHASEEQKAAAAMFLEFCLSDENMTYYATKLGELVSVDGITAEHVRAEAFADVAARGYTMRSLTNVSNKDYWKSELDAMLMGIMYEGADVDEEVAAYTKHLTDMDIKSLIG